MARYADVTQVVGAVGLAAADVKPHRLKTFKLSRDPQFAEKVIDDVGLYVNPPTTRWCSRSTRRYRSGPWTGPLRSSHCGPDRSSAAPTTTSGTELRTCMRPSISQPGRCSDA